MSHGAFTFQVQHRASMSKGPIFQEACRALWKWRNVDKSLRPNRTFPHCLEIRHKPPDFHIPTAPAAALTFNRQQLCVSSGARRLPVTTPPTQSVALAA